MFISREKNANRTELRLMNLPLNPEYISVMYRFISAADPRATKLVRRNKFNSLPP